MTTTSRLRRLALTTIAAAATAMISAPSALATNHAGHAHSTRSHHHNFDAGILSDTNSARTARKAHAYKSNHRLYKIAHAYAEHLAKTGVLEHNPQLQTKATKACPSWTDLGENIGYETGSDPHALFQAYWHSPPHKANLLDKSYTQVGIATVTVTRNGQTQAWNVMDFANHCP